MSIINQIKDSVDIVDLIGRSVELKQNGYEYKACCPFHEEKTPSFTVSQSKQFYHCFGCGAHGSVVDFLIKHENLEFIEAMEMLGEICGIEFTQSESGIDIKGVRAAIKKLNQDIVRNNNIFHAGMIGEYAKEIGVLTPKGVTLNGYTVRIFDSSDKTVGFYSKGGIARSVLFDIDNAFIGKFSPFITDSPKDIKNGFLLPFKLSKRTFKRILRITAMPVFISKNNAETAKKVLRLWVDGINPMFYDGKVQFIEDLIPDNPVIADSYLASLYTGIPYRGHWAEDITDTELEFLNSKSAIKWLREYNLDTSEPISKPYLKGLKWVLERVRAVRESERSAREHRSLDIARVLYPKRDIASTI